MYIADYNRTKGEKKAKNFVFFACFVAWGVYLFIVEGLPFTEITLTAFFSLGLLGSSLGSWLFAPIFFDFFASSLQKKEEAHNLTRTINERRAILAEEFRFLYQVEMMKAEKNREKMQMLAELQERAERAKARDLQRLAEQLAKFKRGQ